MADLLRPLGRLTCLYTSRGPFIQQLKETHLEQTSLQLQEELIQALSFSQTHPCSLAFKFFRYKTHPTCLCALTSERLLGFFDIKLVKVPHFLLVENSNHATKHP